jgi:glycosidase
VDRQAEDPESTLALCRRLVALRRASAALRLGAQTFLDAPAPLIVVRRAHDEQVVLGILNPGDTEVRWRLPDELRDSRVVADLGGEVVSGEARLRPWGALWISRAVASAQC